VNEITALFTRGYKLQEIADKLGFSHKEILAIRKAASQRGLWPTELQWNRKPIEDQERIFRNLLEDGMTVDELRKTRGRAKVSLDRLREIEQEVRKAKAKD
jgi:DNA-directed RNA polymerase specialized sigma subunit